MAGDGSLAGPAGRVCAIAVFVVLLALLVPSLARADDPPWDFFPGVLLEIGTPQTHSNVNATISSNERWTPNTTVLCDGVQMHRTLWWGFTGNNRRVTVTTMGSTPDTVMGMWQASPTEPVRCDDDIVLADRRIRASRIRFTASSSKTYYFQVGNCVSHSACGTAVGDVKIGAYNTPENDDRVEARPVSLGRGAEDNTLGATAETSEPLTCVTPQRTSNYERTVWYRFDATTTGRATLTASGFDAVIAVYRGGSTDQVGCADDPIPGSTQASVSVDVAPGESYFVQVGGFGTNIAEGGKLQYSSSFDDPDPDDDGATGGMDCDETNPGRNHHLPEIANNNVDENCDGVVLIDRDNDGSPAGADCNDSQAAETPGKTEIPKNNLDDDCIGGDNKDGDRDGEADKAAGGKDCNDSNPRINTRANERRGNFVDENCDGKALPGTLRPVPQFDMSGSAFGNGSRVSEVTAYGVKKGYRVRATCRGRGCPKGKTVKVRRNGSVRFKSFSGRLLAAGTVVQVGAWIPGRNVMGEYARFTVRAGNRPRRCFGRLNPPKFRPGRCRRG